MDKDFSSSGNSCNGAPSNDLKCNEYTFIKIKEESFSIISLLNKILKIIFDDFRIFVTEVEGISRSIGGELSKMSNSYTKGLIEEVNKENIEYLNKVAQKTSVKFKSLVDFYLKEINEILGNYIRMTKNLIPDLQVHLNYARDITALSDKLRLNLQYFRNSYIELNKIYFKTA